MSICKILNKKQLIEYCESLNIILSESEDFLKNYGLHNIRFTKMMNNIIDYKMERKFDVQSRWDNRKLERCTRGKGIEEIKRRKM